jgi:cytoskeletal protein RodZ
MPMDKRDVLLGFGAGLIAASGFLFFLPAPAPAPAPSFTQDQLRAAAESLNLVVLSKEEYEQLTQEKKVAVNETARSPKQPQRPAVSTAAKPSSPAPAQTRQPAVSAPAASQQPAKPQTGTSTAAPSAPEAVPIPVTIPYKATAEGVARMMVEAGILPKENKLVETLEAQGKLNRIRVGTYRIRPGTTEAEIVKLITTPPKK